MLPGMSVCPTLPFLCSTHHSNVQGPGDSPVDNILHKFDALVSRDTLLYPWLALDWPRRALKLFIRMRAFCLGVCLCTRACLVPVETRKAH